MTLQYIITGGQLIMDKTAYSRELILADSPMKSLLYGKGTAARMIPRLEKTNSEVIIDFNHTEVETDDGFYDVFRKLKEKYRNKLKGKIVIRISAITAYYVTLNLNSEDSKVIYEE